MTPNLTKGTPGTALPLRRHSWSSGLNPLPRVRTAGRLPTDVSGALPVPAPSSGHSDFAAAGLLVPPLALPVLTTTTAAVAPGATAPTTISNIGQATTTTTTSANTTATTTTTSATTAFNAIGMAPSIVPRRIRRSASFGAGSTAHASTITAMSTPTSGKAGGKSGVSIKLYQAIFDGDLERICQRMRKGDSIFARFDPEYPDSESDASSKSDSEDGDGEAPTSPGRRKVSLLEFAIRQNRPACVLQMLHHCHPSDASQRDAHLLELFRQALWQKEWPWAGQVASYFKTLNLRFGSRDFERVFIHLVREEQITLARFVLETGATFPLTQQQMERMTESALKAKRGEPIKSLLQRHPEVLLLSACSVASVINNASGKALAVLLQHGFVPTGVDGEQLAILLVRLLDAAEQDSAWKLYSQYANLEPPRKPLLEAAVRCGASGFLEQLLKGPDPMLDALNEVLESAIDLGFSFGVFLLQRQGVNLFRVPTAGLAFLDKLVCEEKVHALQVWVESGGVAREIVFSQLIHRQKAKALDALQLGLRLSFCAGMINYLDHPQRGWLCTSSLGELLRKLNLAAQAQNLPQNRMMEVLAQEGFSWATSENLIALHRRIDHAGLSLQSYSEQQCVLAMAAHLDGLEDPAQFAWPGSHQALDEPRLLVERHYLHEWGQQVIFHARIMFERELLLELEPAFNTSMDLGHRLRVAVGLPPTLAHMVRSICRQAWQAKQKRDLRAHPGAVAIAILRHMQRTAPPARNTNDPVSVWHDIGWQTVQTVSAKLIKQFGAQ